MAKNEIVQEKKDNIYDVDSNLENALIYGVDKYGEVLSDEELQLYVEEMQIAMTDKMTAMASITINKEAFVKSIDEEIKKLQDKKKTISNGIERTKDYLDRFIRYKFTNPETGELDEDGLNKFKLETPRTKISYRKSQSVEVLDLNKVPKDCVKVEISEKADKTKIKALMKENGETKNDYAEIKTNINIQIK